MRRSRGTYIILAMLLVSVLLGGCASQATPTAQPGPKKLKVAFVLPGSISDGSFVTMAYQAVQQAKGLPFVEEAAYIEGINAATDAAKAIRDYVAEGYDVVWAHSGVHAATVMEIAPEFPDTVFVALAAPSSDKQFSNVWFSNSGYEGAYYLAGALGGKMSKSGVLGFVGGRENPLYKACSMAYEEGAQSVNPNARALVVFTGDYNDPVKGKEAAISQIQSGADVIAHTMNLGAFGLFAAAEEAGTKVWCIGKDMDQFQQAPTVVLTSIVIDNAIQMKLILTEIAAGKKSGVMDQNLGTGSVYLADFYGQVPSDVAAEMDALKTKILNGQVKYTTQKDVAK